MDNKLTIGEPNVGVEYVIEITDGKENSYKCALCTKEKEKLIDVTNFQTHLKSHKHRENFLKTNFSKFYEELLVILISKNDMAFKTRALKKLSWFIVKKYGSKSSYQCNQKEYDRNFDSIAQKLNSQRFYSEDDCPELINVLNEIKEGNFDSEDYDQGKKQIKKSKPYGPERKAKRRANKVEEVVKTAVANSNKYPDNNFIKRLDRKSDESKLTRATNPRKRAVGIHDVDKIEKVVKNNFMHKYLIVLTDIESHSDSDKKFQGETRIEELKKGRTLMFTDASQNQFNTGIGVVIPSHRDLNYKKILKNFASVEAGEIFAIYRALEIADENGLKQPLVLSDCLFGCKKILQQSKMPKVTDTVYKILKLMHKTKAIIAYIPAHCGIDGNEAADKAARDSLHILDDKNMECNEIQISDLQELENSLRKKDKKKYEEFMKLKLKNEADWKLFW